MKMKVYGLLRNSVQISNMIQKHLILYKLKRDSKGQKNSYIGLKRDPLYPLEQQTHREHTMSEPRANHLLTLYALRSSERCLNGSLNFENV